MPGSRMDSGDTLAWINLQVYVSFKRERLPHICQLSCRIQKDQKGITRHSNAQLIVAEWRHMAT